jgi:hypothetical protein
MISAGFVSELDGQYNPAIYYQDSSHIAKRVLSNSKVGGFARISYRPLKQEKEIENAEFETNIAC